MNIDNKKLNETIEEMVSSIKTGVWIEETVLIGIVGGIQIQIKVTEDEDELIDCQEGQMIEDTPYICISD